MANRLACCLSLLVVLGMLGCGDGGRVAQKEKEPAPARGEEIPAPDDGADKLPALPESTDGAGKAPADAEVAPPSPETETDQPAGGSTPSEGGQPVGDGPILAPAGPQTGDDQPPTDNPNPGTPIAPLTAKETTLIPRDVLFGNPQRAAARLNSNGTRLSFLAPVDGVLNIWVAPEGEMDPAKAKPVTDDKKRGIRSYFWAFTNKHVIYTQDKDGDENWRVYAVNVETGETKDLTPIDGVRAEIQEVSEKFPNEILIGLNNRVPQLHDIYRVNIETGERKLVQENPGVVGFMTDDDYNVRLSITFSQDASQLIMKPDGKGGWETFLKVGPIDAMTTQPAGFDKTGEKLYFIDSRDRNTAALTVIDLATDQQTPIASNPKADVGGVLAHPTEKNIQAVSFTYARREWIILDDTIAEDVKFLNTVEDGEFQVTGRTLDDKLWTVAYIVDDGPVKFYIYDRDAKKTQYLFSSRDDLDQYQLTKMHPVIIKSRDGLDLISYLSLPRESDTDGDALPDGPLPLVLDVHGGPWARDGWGYNSMHQWLTNRGYAVLSVNFRGSTGFGKEFINAANGEWSGNMHDDLLDAVDWAIEQKIAQKNKVAIMGGSYGGYATLVGLTYTPDVFACGVDIVGPSSLVTLLENVPAYWMPFMPVMKDRVGDHTTEEGRLALLEKSPLTKVDQIERPLLIGQGANDPRVKQQEADQIVAAMTEKKIPVTYVLYPDEGHGFARPANRLSFNAVVEAFLAEHLGGRYQPVDKDFEGATLQVPAGASQVPGLEEALAAHAKASKDEEPPGKD
jgi:dipeptidyl aminopeptidase/acylaminoacyl peptidase